MTALAPDTNTRSRAHWIVMLAICAGALGVVLAALPYKAFELDRHFVPKEIALHLSATIAALFALIGVTRIRMTRVDVLLIAYIILSAISAIAAPNSWLAIRALGISYSGIALFWAAGVVGRDRLLTPLFTGLMIAMLAGVLTALAQAYGVVGDYASLSRAPGGTFGNRNFMAHLAVICMPMLVYLTVRAEKRGFIGGAVAIILLSGALVLSRSRAAWLALLVTIVICLPILWRLRRFAKRVAPPSPTTGPTPARSAKRLVTLTVAAALGVAAALLIPNTLEWKSDSPYLDSVRGVVNYKEGSGHGRMLQYRHTLRLALGSPLLGVGTGNWSVVYPKNVPSNDPSIATDGRTANPWPSSDWMAILSERGLPAFLCFALAMLGMIVGAAHRWALGKSLDDRISAITLGATVLITLIVGAFDAVLSLAIPSLFAWTIFGALVPRHRTRHDTTITRPIRWLVMGGALIVGGLFSMRSIAQAYAMGLYDQGTTAGIRKAAAVDPSSYRILLKLATLEANRGRCANVRIHAGAAHKLYPDAPQPIQLLNGCGVHVGVDH